MAQQSIVGYAVDEEEGAWIALLACGHKQHLRHDPPWQDREWVLSEAGRRAQLGQALDCPFCDMPALPEAARVYKSTREFTESTVPKGLLAHHKTQEGSWARIVVSEGRLLYCLEAAPTRGWVLRPGIVGIVAPAVLHRVEPQGRVRFRVEFLRLDRER